MLGGVVRHSEKELGTSRRVGVRFDVDIVLAVGGLEDVDHELHARDRRSWHLGRRWRRPRHSADHASRTLDENEAALVNDRSGDLLDPGLVAALIRNRVREEARLDPGDLESQRLLYVVLMSLSKHYE